MIWAACRVYATAPGQGPLESCYSLTLRSDRAIEPFPIELFRTVAHLCATLVSSVPREQLERIHERVLSHNMVLGALRGVPQTSELVTLPLRAAVAEGVL